MDQAEQLRNVIKKRTKSLAQDARVIVVTSVFGKVMNVLSHKAKLLNIRVFSK